MGPLRTRFPICEMGCHHLPHKVVRNTFQHAGHAAEPNTQHTLSQGPTHVGSGSSRSLLRAQPFWDTDLGPATQQIPGPSPPRGQGQPGLPTPSFLLGTNHVQTQLAPEDSACAHWQKLLALCVD